MCNGETLHLSYWIYYFHTHTNRWVKTNIVWSILDFKSAIKEMFVLRFSPSPIARHIFNSSANSKIDWLLFLVGQYGMQKLMYHWVFHMTQMLKYYGKCEGLLAMNICGFVDWSHTQKVTAHGYKGNIQRPTEFHALVICLWIAIHSHFKEIVLWHTLAKFLVSNQSLQTHITERYSSINKAS